MKATSLVLALWENGLLSESAVIAWADKHISQSATPPNFLIELSLHGPKGYIRRLESDFPRPESLSFKECFALRANNLTLTADNEVWAFVEWVSRAAMGGNLQDPMVAFGYQVEHLWMDREDMAMAVTYVRSELPKLTSLFKPIATEINARIA